MGQQLAPGDALLVVDMQNDFIEGGSLAVAGSLEIIAPINRLIELFAEAGLPIYASRDYHPADHSSFAGHGGTWPPHCIAGTPGAELHPEINLPDTATLIDKATSAEREAYSALDRTGLGELLHRQHIQRVAVCGLATDYCVLASAKDLLAAGFKVQLVTDTIRAVNVTAGDGDRAIAALVALGVETITTSDLMP